MVPQTLSRSGSALAVALLLALMPACQTIPFETTWEGDFKTPPTQVIVNWQNRVCVVPNTANGGKSFPALAGRMYLLGDDMKKFVPQHGKVRVELFDMTATGPGIEPRMLEFWELDDGNLQKFFRKDQFGQGYTLVLPWNTFDPNLSRVKMHVAFTPDKGAALYSQPSVVTLNPDAPLPITESQVLPTGHRVPVSREQKK